VFQALVQNRPYREQLSSSEIISILHEMDLSHKIDKSVLHIIELTTSQNSTFTQ